MNSDIDDLNQILESYKLKARLLPYNYLYHKDKNYGGNQDLHIEQIDESSKGIILPFSGVESIFNTFEILKRRENYFLNGVMFYNIDFKWIELSDSKLFKDLSERSVLDIREKNIFDYIRFRSCNLNRIKIYINHDSKHKFTFTFTSKIDEYKHLDSIVNILSYDCSGGHDEEKRVAARIEVEDLECNIIELRQSNPAIFTNCHFSLVNHYKLSPNCLLDIFSPSISKLTDKDIKYFIETNSMKASYDSAIYTWKNVYSVQSSQDAINYNIELLKSNLESSRTIKTIRLLLIKFHRGYSNIVSPFLLFSGLIILTLNLISFCELGVESLNPTKYISYLVEDFSFKSETSWVKVISIPINLLTTYSLFCFLAALRKRLGFKKP